MAGFRALSFVVQVCVCALLLVASPSAAWERNDGTSVAVTEFGYQSPGQGGSRKLLQNMVNSCQYDFSKVDYSSVTSVCKGPNYDMKTCCAPFTKLACQYKPQINDFNSLCPIYFLSYLNVAGGYTSGVFVGDGRCNSGSALCPN